MAEKQSAIVIHFDILAGGYAERPAFRFASAVPLQLTLHMGIAMCATSRCRTTTRSAYVAV